MLFSKGNNLNEHTKHHDHQSPFLTRENFKQVNC